MYDKLFIIFTDIPSNINFMVWYKSFRQIKLAGFYEYVWETFIENSWRILWVTLEYLNNRNQRNFCRKRVNTYKILTKGELFFILRYNPSIAKMKMYRNTRSKSLKISLHYGSYVSELCLVSTMYFSKSFIFHKVLCYMQIVLRSRYKDWRRAGRSWEWIPVRSTIIVSIQTGSEAHPASCKMGTG